MSTNNDTSSSSSPSSSGTTTTTKKPDEKIFRIAVGSKNPCKVNAVRHAVLIVMKQVQQKESMNNDNDNNDNDNGFEYELDVQGFSAPSGVPDQPFGDAETQLGAKNRAESAYNSYKENNDGVAPHLAVGLEGGLEWSDTVMDEEGSKTLWCMAWMAIYGERTAFVANCLSSSSSSCNNNNNDTKQNLEIMEDKRPIFGLSKTGSFLLPTVLGKLIRQGMELGEADDKAFGRDNSGQGSGTVGILTNGIIDRSAYYEHALVLALIPWIRPDVFPAQQQQQQQQG